MEYFLEKRSFLTDLAPWLPQVTLETDIELGGKTKWGAQGVSEITLYSNAAAEMQQNNM